MSDTPETEVTASVEPADKFYKTDEPEHVEPTEESVTTQEQAPEQEVEELAKPEESEESGSEESQYVEIDGKEIDLDDVRKWRDGHLMQSDYTKKTTALAEERTSFNTERTNERENLLKEKTDVSGMRDLLSVLVAEDEVINWAELKEDDPDRYIELKERADKRKDALEKVKLERETPADDPALIATEQGKLFAANPEWLDKDNKPTELFTKETTLMNDYAIKAGFSSDEFKQLTRAHYLTTILKAAKYDQLQDKGRKIKEKREKLPVTTRPKASKAGQETTMAERFYGKNAG